MRSVVVSGSGSARGGTAGFLIIVMIIGAGVLAGELL
jgi:hypothetical protein